MIAPGPEVEVLADEVLDAVDEIRSVPKHST